MSGFNLALFGDIIYMVDIIHVVDDTIFQGFVKKQICFPVCILM